MSLLYTLGLYATVLSATSQRLKPHHKKRPHVTAEAVTHKTCPARTQPAHRTILRRTENRKLSENTTTGRIVSPCVCGAFALHICVAHSHCAFALRLLPCVCFRNSVCGSRLQPRHSADRKNRALAPEDYTRVAL